MYRNVKMNYSSVNFCILFAIIVSSVSAQKVYFDSQFPPAPGRRVNAVGNGNSFRRSNNGAVRTGDRYQAAQVEDNSLDADAPVETEAPSYMDGPFEPVTPSAGVSDVEEKVVDGDAMQFKFGTTTVKQPSRPMISNGNGFVSRTVDEDRQTFRPVTTPTRFDTGREEKRVTTGVARDRETTGVGNGVIIPEIDGGVSVDKVDEKKVDIPDLSRETDIGDRDNAIDTAPRQPDISINGIQGVSVTGRAKPGVGDHDHGHYDEHDHHGDPIEWLKKAIRGEPGVDYPIYGTIIQTSFLCSSQRYPGYYADVEARCQIFHICQADGRSDAFLCPNGTIFSQKHFVCVWWNQFDCSKAETYYELNADLYKEVPVKELQPRPMTGVVSVGEQPIFTGGNGTPKDESVGDVDTGVDEMSIVDKPTATNGANGGTVTTGVVTVDKRPTIVDKETFPMEKEVTGVDIGDAVDVNIPSTKDEGVGTVGDKDEKVDDTDEESVDDDGVSKKDEEDTIAKETPVTAVGGGEEVSVDGEEKIITSKPDVTDDGRVSTIDDQQAHQDVQVYEDSPKRRTNSVRTLTRFLNNKRTRARSSSRVRSASRSFSLPSNSFKKQNYIRNQVNTNHSQNGRQQAQTRVFKRKGNIIKRNGRGRP